MADFTDRKQEKDRRFADEALCWLPDVARFAISLTHSEADADDLVQETFLRAYQAWDTYVPGTECRGWLFTICRNTYYRQQRRDRPFVQCDDPDLEALAAVAVHDSAQTIGLGDLFARIDLRDALDAALQALPDQFREAVILVDVQDLSYEAAAESAGVPVGTIRSRLFRARRLLQESLVEHAKDLGLAKPMMPQMNDMKPMIDCHTVMRQLWDYLDGELTPDRAEAIEEHLRMCQRCYPQYEFERTFLDQVGKLRREHSDIERLRSQLLDALKAHGFVAA